ncbi:uncharacterized protein LOC125306150 [Alosa alosa]|uniref:uncharacterized protein LOC125306150 n=1 Tax=Alosa alosa TaxID=278164 RepID=UPI0020154BB6|nr:uncharacterized protein LOC125306150 [Alosa alosa]
MSVICMLYLELMMVSALCCPCSLEVEALTDEDVANLAGALGAGKTLSLRTIDSLLSESGVEKVLCALAKQTSVDAYFSLSALTAGTLKHLVHYVQNAKGRASVRWASNQVEEEDYLSWYLTVKTTKGRNCFSLTLVASSRCGFVQSGSAGPISALSLSLFRAADLSSFQWTDVLQRSHTLWLTEKEGGLPAHVDGQMSALALVPGLKGVQLEVHPRIVHPCWATGVLSLMQACSTLDNIQLSGGQFGNGLLTEEGLKLLHDSEKRGDYKLIIKGAKCTKITDKCTENRSNLSYNQICPDPGRLLHRELQGFQQCLLQRPQDPPSAAACFSSMSRDTEPGLADSLLESVKTEG